MPYGTGSFQSLDGGIASQFRIAQTVYRHDSEQPFAKRQGRAHRELSTGAVTDERRFNARLKQAAIFANRRDLSTNEVLRIRVAPA